MIIKQQNKTEQLSDLQEIANNDEFLSKLNSIIAKVEAAIAIADKVEEAPSKNKGGSFRVWDSSVERRGIWSGY